MFLENRNERFVANTWAIVCCRILGCPQAREHDTENIMWAEPPAHQRSSRAQVSCGPGVGIATGLVVVGDLIGSGDAQERGIMGEAPNRAARIGSAHRAAP